MTQRLTFARLFELPVFQKTILISVLAVFYGIHLIALPASEIVNFIPDDGFFYPKIVQNFLLGYGITFDRIAPTTDFHWGWFCTLGVWLKFLSLFYSAVLTSPNVLLIAAMTATFGVKLIEAWLSVTLLTLLVGKHPLLSLLMLFSAVRAFIYGSLMETDLLLVMLLGCAILFVSAHAVQRSKLRGAVELFAAFGTVFTRIDYSVLFLLLLVVCLFRRQYKGVRLPAIVRNFSLGAIAGVAASSLLDFAVGGIPVSTSALLKSHGLSVSFSRFVHVGKFFFPMDAVCILLAILVGAFLFVRFWRFRTVMRKVAWMFSGIIGLLVFHIAVNNLIAAWYFEPFFCFMYLLVSVIIVFMAKNFGKTTRWMVSTIAVAAILVFLSRQTLRQGKISHTPVYNFALMVENSCRPNDTIFAEDYCGILSFFSGCRVVSGDGLVNSNEYIHDYLLTGNVSEYLREKKILYHAVTTMNERQFSSQHNGPQILDTLKPFFLNVPASVIVLQRKNQVLSYYDGEHDRFFALFKLQ